MQDISFTRESANVEALDAELRAALGALMLGVSAAANTVTVHLAAPAAPDQAQHIGQIVRDHDAARLTPRQQAELARRALIDDARSRHAGLLDPADFAAEPDAIRRLADRLAWLELELRELRGV